MERDNRTILLVLVVVSMLGPFSIDTYLPALPEMADSLAVSDSLMQLTVTAYLLGFAIGPLVFGTISDAVGRRPVLMGALVVYIAASAAIAVAGSGTVIVALRIVQAVGGGTAAVLTRTIAGDLYSGNRLARVLSILLMILLMAPMIAPSLGGQILRFFDWRAIFWLLTILGTVALITVIAGLRETLPPERRSRVRVGEVLRGYAAIGRDGPTMAYAVAGGASGAAMFAYIAATPFIYIDYYGLDPELYGLLFGANVVGGMAANIINARIVTRFGYRRMVVAGVTVLLAAGIAVFAQTLTDVGGLLGLAALVFWVVATAQLISPNAMAGILDRFPARGGAASAMTAFVRFMMAVAATTAVSALNDGTPRHLGIVVLVAALVSATAAVVVVRLAPDPRRGDVDPEPQPIPA